MSACNEQHTLAFILTEVVLLGNVVACFGSHRTIELDPREQRVTMRNAAIGDSAMTHGHEKQVIENSVQMGDGASLIPTHPSNRLE